MATREQLRALTENVPVSLACFDVKSLQFVYANSRFARLVGRDLITLIGMTFEQAVGPEIANEIQPYVETMLADRNSIKFGYHLPRPDGVSLWFDVHLVPELNAEDQVALC